MNMLTLIACIFFSLNTYAGLHFEPLAYYTLGDTLEKNTNIEFKQKGYLYGGRLGLYKSQFMIGAEYLTGEVEFERQDNNFEFDQTPHYMGGYLGYHLKRRVGLNFSYFLKYRSNTDFSKNSGVAWKAEFYYRVKTNISLRIGYMHSTLDFNEDTNTDLADKIESKTFLLGLSFPFVL